MKPVAARAKFIKYIGVPDFTGIYPCQSTAILEQPSVSQNGLFVGNYRVFSSRMAEGIWSEPIDTGMRQKPGVALYVDMPQLKATPAWNVDRNYCEIPTHFLHCVPDGYEPEDIVEDALKVQNFHHGRDIYVEYSYKGSERTPGGFGGAKYRCMLHGFPGAQPIRIVQSPKVFAGPNTDTYLTLIHFSSFEKSVSGTVSVFLCAPDGQVLGNCDINLESNRCYAISMKSLLRKPLSKDDFIGTIIAVAHADVVPLVYTFSGDGRVCSLDHSVPPMKYMSSFYRSDVKVETARSLIASLKARMPDPMPSAAFEQRQYRRD